MEGVNSADGTSGTQFRIRDVSVDPRVGVISGPGGTLRLEPKVMTVLQILARHPGELVSRSELLAQIWPGVDIYDEALTQCVYQLRQQLTSAGGDNSYKDLINTIPKRGYVLKEGPLPLDSLPSITADATGSPSKALRIWLTAVLLIFGLAFVYYQWGGASSTSDASKPQVLAVLPFLPLTAEHHNPELELGMADTLIAHLGKINRIIVRPITSVRRYGELDRDSLQAGQELAVDAVVDGTIQRNEGQIRINVRLLRVADGVAIWTGTFDENFSDIFAVQGEISRRIVDELSLPLGRQEKERLGYGGTLSVDAYQSYLAGRYHLYRLTPLDLQTSVTRFRQAVTLDPNYALAWVGLASAMFRSPLGGEVPPGD